MGYDLHITRAEDWSDPDDSPIALDEWLAVATTDTDLTAMPENGDAFFAFGDANDDARGWFDWSEGNVYTKNPDKRILAKMLTLAVRLNARVHGDDGEPYESLDDLGVSPRKLSARANSSSAATPSGRDSSSDGPSKGLKWRLFRR